MLARRVGPPRRPRPVSRFARDEAAKLGHDTIGPQHVLLGLLRDVDLLTQTLAEAGVTLEAARAEVEVRTGRGEGAPDREGPTVTMQARRVMEFSGIEARRPGATAIATTHLLLGLLLEGEGGTYDVLGRLAGDVEGLRRRVEALPDPREQEGRELIVVLERLDRLEQEVQELREALGRRG